MSDMKTGLVKQAFDFAMSVDSAAAKAEIEALREKFPRKSNRSLAKKLIRRARWWATGCGVGTGIPANPWIMVPAALVDVGAVFRIQVVTACRIALLYDPTFLDSDEPPSELLVPIFGVRLAGEVVKEAVGKGGMGLTRVAIRKYLSKEALKKVQRIALKYFGIKVTQRAVITKTLPIIGGLIGGGWNYGEFSLVMNRVIAYFEKDS